MCIIKKKNVTVVGISTFDSEVCGHLTQSEKAREFHLEGTRAHEALANRMGTTSGRTSLFERDVHIPLEGSM